MRLNFWNKPRTIVVRKVYPVDMRVPTDDEFADLLNLGLQRRNY